MRVMAARKPVWLWASSTGVVPADVDRWWQAFLRRFDLEHTFRLPRSSLAWKSLFAACLTTMSAYAPSSTFLWADP